MSSEPNLLARLASLAMCSVALALSACAVTPTGPESPTSPAVAAEDVSDIVRAAERAASAAQAAKPASAASGVAAGPSSAAPIDPLRPEVQVDLDSQTAHNDLWVRLRSGFGMPDLDTPLVERGEQWYAARPEYVQRMATRGSRYLFHIVEEVERRGMPTELALLPFIESAFNPQAVSSAKASGMWQFMPATGKYFDLRQNVFRDDRRDVLASTRAALDYLSKLHGMFGDWHLALAAYNWGEGSVQRAIRRNQRAGLPTDYLSLRMPEETQYYVPKLQAVKNIFARPADFGLQLPPLENHPYFLSVPIERDIDVDVAIRLSGVTREEFQILNPQMNKPVILAAGTPQLLLPYDNASKFIRNLAAHQGQLASWTAWVAPKTVHPSDAARQVGMTESELRQINKIPPLMLVRSGSTLLVPRSESRVEDVSPHLADNAVMSLTPDVPPLTKRTLRAGKKESVQTVARRYKLSAQQVANWNNTSVKGRFKPGQSIVIYVQSKGKSSAGTATAKRRAAQSTKTASTRQAAKSKAKAAPRKAAAKGKATTRVAAKSNAKVVTKTAARKVN